MITYIEEHKELFIQCQAYERRNEASFVEGTILKSLSFTNDNKHLIAAQKGSVSAYALNGWEPMSIKFQIPLPNTDVPSLSTANNSTEQVAVYSDSSKQLVVF